MGTLLLRDSRVDPSLHNNHALRLAVINDRIEIVMQLLADPRVDPTFHNGEALHCAIVHYRVGIVQLLLQDGRIVPNTQHLNGAIHRGDIELLRVMLEDPRVVSLIGTLDAAHNMGREDMASLLYQALHHTTV